MKKRNILIETVISIIITFIFAEIFSLYHFGDIPTLLTALYLISIFSIIEYVLLSFDNIIRKILTKEKIKCKEIFGRILLFIALLLIVIFIIVIDVDWLNWYAYSSPFYINIIARSIEFLLPSILLIIISVLLINKSNKI